MVNISDLVGVPFKNGGRDLTGLDCYGLVKVIYQRYGIELPEYTVNAFDFRAVNALYQEEKRLWVPIDDPVFPDILAMKFNSPLINHVGIYLENRQFMHARERSSVCIESIDHIYWKRAIAAYYRWRG